VTDSRAISTGGLRALGMMLIVIGLLIASMAFIPDGEGIVIVFPFVFGNVGGWGAAVLTLTFFALFILSSLLPWYMIQRRSRLNSGFEAIKREGGFRGRDPNTMDYIITTELPERLRRDVYIEAGEEAIHLRSPADEAFLRSYTLPKGFDVDEIHYDYEGKYLIMKLLLKRSV